MQENTGQTRVLAAIVFTDVAGFSRIAGLNEERALEMLGRDFSLMRKSCENHAGRVVNVMGDGLMMTFPSAVEAMQCALEIQSELKRRSLGGAADDVLHHRIGVHVGDVVIDKDNVYGDGVNVASRLQAEARPDAICFSRVVHDVIKNKVPVQAVYLGPRTLKNIPERIMVWQAMPGGDPTRAPSADFGPMAEPETGAIGAKGVILLVLSLVLIALVVGAVILVPRLAPSPAPQPIPPHKKKKPPEKTPDKPAPSPATDLNSQLDSLRRQYEFSQMGALLQAAPAGSVPDVGNQIQRYQSLSDMRDWLAQELARATQEAPIRASVDLGGGQVPCTIYTGPGGLTVDPGSNPQLRTLASLSPESVYSILQVVSQASDAPSMATQWLLLFAEEYRLTNVGPSAGGPPPSGQGG